MMTISPARENTQAMSAMAINSWGIEAFACVWAGGTCLVAGAGHVAAGGPSDRQAVRARQILREERSLLRATACVTGCRNRCKSCAGPTAVFASAAAGASPSTGGDMLKRTIRQWEIR